jgi:DHA2 family multidrug resistance protein
MGYTATWSGMTTAWSGVFAVMVAPFAAKLSARVDARRLVFFGLSWLALMTFIRSFGFTDMTYWQIALPLLFMGFGMPFFFVPLNSIALSSVNPEETASAAGLMSFLRTLGGAIATSVVNTSWENRMRLNHADLAGQIDPTGEATRSLLETGMGMDGVRNTLDRLLEVQSVMLSTNQLFFVIAIVLFISGCTIWLAPRSSRVTNAGGAH